MGIEGLWLAVTRAYMQPHACLAVLTARAACRVATPAMLMVGHCVGASAQEGGNSTCGKRIFTFLMKGKLLPGSSTRGLLPDRGQPGVTLGPAGPVPPERGSRTDLEVVARSDWESSP